MRSLLLCRATRVRRKRSTLNQPPNISRCFDLHRVFVLIVEKGGVCTASSVAYYCFLFCGRRNGCAAVAERMIDKRRLQPTSGSLHFPIENSICNAQHSNVNWVVLIPRSIGTKTPMPRKQLAVLVRIPRKRTKKTTRRTRKLRKMERSKKVCA